MFQSSAAAPSKESFALVTPLFCFYDSITLREKRPPRSLTFSPLKNGGLEDVRLSYWGKRPIFRGYVKLRGVKYNCETLKQHIHHIPMWENLRHLPKKIKKKQSASLPSQILRVFASLQTTWNHISCYGCHPGCRRTIHAILFGMLVI